MFRDLLRKSKYIAHPHIKSNTPNTISMVALLFLIWRLFLHIIFLFSSVTQIVPSCSNDRKRNVDYSLYLILRSSTTYHSNLTHWKLTLHSWACINLLSDLMICWKVEVPDNHVWLSTLFGWISQFSMQRYCFFLIYANKSTEKFIFSFIW